MYILTFTANALYTQEGLRLIAYLIYYKLHFYTNYNTIYPSRCNFISVKLSKMTLKTTYNYI